MPNDATRPRWWPTSLGEATTWLSGGTPSKATPSFWRGDIPWVSPKDMKQFRTGDAQDRITPAGVAAGSRLAPPGSVLIVVRGMILAHTFPVCLTTREVAFNQDVKAVLPGQSVDGCFLGHWFVGHSKRLLGLTTQATHGTKRIELRDLKAFPFELPPLPEQRRIAEILDTIDEAIRKTEQVIAKLQQMKQGLLHDLLTRGIDENGELRDPERNPEQFQNSPLGRIPKAWGASEFGACLEGTPTNGLYKPSSHYGRAGTPIVRIDGFYDGVLAPIESLKRLSVTSAEASAYGLAEGDILVNRVNSIDFVGKAALVPQLEESVVFESNMMRCRLRRDDLVPAFAIRWVAGSQARLWFHSRAKNAIAQASINQLDVRQLLIPTPPLVEQDMVVSRVVAADARTAAERSQLEKLRILKQGVMDDLLSGRVRVRVPEGATP